MSTYGLIGLLIAFAGVAVSVVCLFAGYVLGRKNKGGAAETLVWGGHIAVVLTAVALTFCCGILVYCFMTGDTSIEYVVEYQSNSTSEFAWLYKLAGLWGGSRGSLLFWAWLISVFNSVVAIRNMRKLDDLDTMALFVSQLVLAAFAGVLLFSETNMPFVALDSMYLDENGELTNGAQIWGMNSLLEHWAMAIHPPTTFIGYAGLTVPFAYAIAALIVNDPSKKWVDRSARYAMFSWLFLGIGIGLGSVWAYVVLGWGGYWGWDPVENASLLSWLAGVALIHSFTVYRQRGAFKRWSIMCACTTFSFVIVGTFITRSGIVQSVHAFAGDPTALVLFLSLIILSLVAGIVGLVVRRKSFAPAASGADNVDSLVSKDAAYYFNNVIMIVFAVLLCYLTVSSALPSWMPFGGQSLTAGTYNTIARPLGVLYCLILAVCPLLSWGRTEGRVFWKRARIPGICALVLFAALMVYFFTYLVPTYEALVKAGGTAAASVTDYGPAAYYYALTILGFAAASLVFFNSLFILARGVRAYARTHKKNVFVSFFGALHNHASTFGGFISHFAMSIILVGLIGSAMYVTEKVAYLDYDESTGGTSEVFTVKDYRLEFTSESIEELHNGTDVLYTIEFDAYKGDQYIGHVAPSVLLDGTTQQTKLNASVISLPMEDLFVVYRGVDSNNAFVLDVRVNPLISFVWVGFALLMVGMLVSFVGRHRPINAGKPGEIEVAEEAASAEGADGSDASAGSDGPGAAAAAGAAAGKAVAATMAQARGAKPSSRKGA